MLTKPYLEDQKPGPLLCPSLVIAKVDKKNPTEYQFLQELHLNKNYPITPLDYIICV